MQELIKNLKLRGFTPRVFETSQQAKDFLYENLKDTTIGMGGSVTISELGLYQLLKENNQVYCHSFDHSPDVLKNAALAKIYISGVNAIAQTGEIVNIDGRGNRVSSQIWGANRERVIYICGINKITKDLHSALFRAKNVAAPLNARRLNLKTPCAVKADKCYNCNSPQKICRVISILNNPTSAAADVVIINENLGY